MSLVNDVLKDLQTRQAVGAHPLAGLRPASRSARPMPWRAAAGGLLVIALGTTAWGLEVVRRPAVSNQASVSMAAAAAQTGSTDPASEPTPDSRPHKTLEAPPGLARTLRVASAIDPAGSRPVTAGATRHPVRTLRLATVTDFAGSRQAMPLTHRAGSAGDARRRTRVSPAGAAAPAVRETAVSPRDATSIARDERPVQRSTPAQSPAGEQAPSRVVVQRADGASPADRAYRRGVANLAAGDVEGAVSAFTTAVDLDASMTDGWRRLASAYLGTGRIDLAVAALRRGVATAGEPTELRLMLARALVDAGRDAAALSVLESEVASPVRAPTLAAFRAAVLQRVGRHEESAALYETLVALRPQEGAWWVGLGISRETLGHAEPALLAYRRATAIAPTPPSLARYADQRIARLQSRSH